MLDDDDELDLITKWLIDVELTDDEIDDDEMLLHFEVEVEVEIIIIIDEIDINEQ